MLVAAAMLPVSPQVKLSGHFWRPSEDFADPFAQDGHEFRLEPWIFPEKTLIARAWMGKSNPLRPMRFPCRDAVHHRGVSISKVIILRIAPEKDRQLDIGEPLQQARPPERRAFRPVQVSARAGAGRTDIPWGELRIPRDHRRSRAKRRAMHAAVRRKGSSKGRFFSWVMRPAPALQ